MRNVYRLSMLALAMGAAIPALSQPKGVDTTRDARNNGPTADNQKNNQSDHKMTADIGKAVVGDKSLSTLAHNVKIVTQTARLHSVAG